MTNEMQLSDLINEYRANGYVLQSAGSGSTSPMWIDYQEAIEIDASLADTEMHKLIGGELTTDDLAEYRLAIGDETALVSHVSDWHSIDNGSDYSNNSDYRWRILF